MTRKSEILSQEDINTIKSKAHYWNEVQQRENCSDIVYAELRSEVSRLGCKILWVLEDYAKMISEDKNESF